jgi:hypothetical protein
MRVAVVGDIVVRRAADYYLLFQTYHKHQFHQAEAFYIERSI